MLPLWRDLAVMKSHGKEDFCGRKGRLIVVVSRFWLPVSRRLNLTLQPRNSLCGLFLAELTGKTFYTLPRRAFYGKDRILVVNTDKTTELRQVMVIRTERDELLLVRELVRELVAISPVPNVIDGMSVKINREPGNNGENDVNRIK